MKTTSLDEIMNFRRDKLQELLDKCPEGSRNLFLRMYGTTNANELDDDKIDWAIQQCENTLRKFGIIDYLIHQKFLLLSLIVLFII